MIFGMIEQWQPRKSGRGRLAAVVCQVFHVCCFPFELQDCCRGDLHLEFYL